MNTTQTQVRSTEEALKLALEALEKHGDAYLGHSDEYQFAITKVKEALAQPELCKYGQEPKSCTSSPMDCQCALDATFAQPEQKPVAWLDVQGNGIPVPVYTNPPTPKEPEQEPVAWVPYLSDRADGVKGRYAIARWNPRGYREVWNLRRHEWGAYSDDVLSLEEADTLLRLITIPTRKVTSPQPPQPKEPEQEPDLGGVDVFYPKDEHYKTVIKGVQRLFDDKRQLASDAIQKEIDAYKAANPHCDVVAIVGDLAPYRRRTIGLPDSAPLYTTPPTQQSCSQRQCNVKPLTDAQINVIWDSLIARPDYSREMIVRAFEAAHGIKGDA